MHVKRFEFSQLPPRCLSWFVFEALASVKEVEATHSDEDRALDREFRLRCKALGIAIIGRNNGGFAS
ncbi:hypothetical protein AAVH_20976 [Aphelenchoides avenae]|nr:hypothetical protein AAVH_20976 [Aphelenchus avenae]